MQVAALVQIRSKTMATPDGAVTPSTLQWQQLLQLHCKSEGLSAFKVPRSVRCQTQPLPVNGSGKVIKEDVLSALRVARYSKL